MLTDYKKQWLQSMGYADMQSIVDCDPNAQTITFNGGTKRQLVERWTRVMGYHRPVSSFNKGKQSEHRERVHFVECACRA